MSNTDKQILIHYDEELLQKSATLLANNDVAMVSAYNEFVAKADEELKIPVNPVTNKSLTPPSGDKHDYYTIAPYFWPDPTKEDGMPWKQNDGVVNPLIYKDDTDWNRLRKLFESLKVLSLTYYFSKDKKYAEKIREIIVAWFIAEETKVNPRVQYGSVFPRKGNPIGSSFGILPWTGISNLIIALQLLSRDNILSDEETIIMDKWLGDYLDWLLTSELGRLEQIRLNNHGTKYDEQSIGLMIYLGRMDEARAALEYAKLRRIASQLEANGSQPLELKRTKSASYSTMNLESMLKLAVYAKRFTDIDLWNFVGERGSSIKKALEFLAPYAQGDKDWEWAQITEGGADAVFEERVHTVFTRATVQLGAPEIQWKKEYEMTAEIRLQLGIGSN